MPPRENRHGIPDLGPVHPLQPPARGLGRQRRRRDRRGRRRVEGRRRPERRRHRRRTSAIRADRADGFVLKQHQGPPRQGARHLRARVGRLPAHQLQGLLQRPVRNADLRRGPRRPGALRGRRPRRLGHLPRRGRRDRRAASRGHRRSVTTRRSASATCTTTWRATRAPTATPSTSTTTGIYDNALGPPDRRRHRRRDTPAIRATRCWSRTTSSTRTTSTSTRRTRPSSPRSRSRSAPGSGSPGGNHHQVRNNYFYDNWRRGTMLFSVPDQLVCGPAAGDNQSGRLRPQRPDDVVLQLRSTTTTWASARTARPTRTARTSGGTRTRGPSATAGGATPRRRARRSPNRPPRLRSRTATTARTPARASAPATRRQTGELLSCIAAFETRMFDPNGPVPVVQDAVRAPARCRQPRHHRPRGRVRAGRSRPRCRGRPAATSTGARDLSGVSCAQWNAAGDSGRAWLVDKITEFAGGLVNDGTKIVGYGDTLTVRPGLRPLRHVVPRAVRPGLPALQALHVRRGGLQERHRLSRSPA